MPTPNATPQEKLSQNKPETKRTERDGADKPQVDLPKNPRPPAQSQLDKERAEGEGMTSPTSDR